MSQVEMLKFVFTVLVALSMAFLCNGLVARFLGERRITKYIQLTLVPLFIALFIFFIFYLAEPYGYAVGLVPIVILAFIVIKYYFFSKSAGEEKGLSVQSKKFDRKKRVTKKKP